MSQTNLADKGMLNYYADYVVWSSNKAKESFKDNLLVPGFNLEELKTFTTEPDHKLIFELFQKIRAKAEPGISFREEHLNYDKITDGLCSAISLHWIFSHLKAQKASELKTPSSSKAGPSSKAPSLQKTSEKILSITSSIFPLQALCQYLNFCTNGSLAEFQATSRKPLPSSLEERISKIGKQYLFGASKEIAASQNAFNTIAIDTSKEAEIDLKRAKVQSLANLYTMRISTHTDSEVLSSEAFRTAQNLEDGIYLIRSLRLCNNHKGEWYGHSQALLKERGELIFQDPCFGTIRITNDKLGQEAFTNCLTQFGLDEVRFYKMELTA